MYSSIHSFINSFIHPSIHPSIHSFIHSFIHLFIHSFDQAFIHPFIPPSHQKVQAEVVALTDHLASAEKRLRDVQAAEKEARQEASQVPV
jgi:hypothetical protein